MTPPLRIIFMGTPEFAVPCLKALANRPDLGRIVGVFTQPDRPAGRGMKMAAPSVKMVAETLQLPVFQPENINHPDEKRRLADLMADIVVVVAYAQFLSPAVLHTPRLGCINVHSSLLPKYRGAAPIQYAIWKGEKESGVTTMKLVPKMDAGPILLQKSIPVGDKMTASQLHDELSRIGGELIVETLGRLKEGVLEEIPQDESQATYAPLIKKEDGLIEWDKTGDEIIHQIRALNPWPGTYGRSTRGNLKIHEAAFHPQIKGISGAPAEAAIGSVFSDTGSLLVKCRDGWIEVLVIQPEGRKTMPVQDFLNGLRNTSIAFGVPHENK